MFFDTNPAPGIALDNRWSRGADMLVGRKPVGPVSVDHKTFSSNSAIYLFNETNCKSLIKGLNLSSYTLQGNINGNLCGYFSSKVNMPGDEIEPLFFQAGNDLFNAFALKTALPEPLSDFIFTTGAVAEITDSRVEAATLLVGGSS